jgi:hypothetical protein
MATTIHRFAIGGAAVFAPLAIAALVLPAVSRAAECGAGTVFDAASNTCVVAEAPPPLPPPPTPPPPWNGPTPYVSVGICAPIPFVSLCAGI